MTRGAVRATAILLFLGLTFFYLFWSAGELSGRGYVHEEEASGLQMMAVFNAWVKGRPIPPMLWSRHGPLPVILDLPFLKLGKLYATPDYAMSFQPILLTAGMAAIAFLWLRTFASPGVSLALTMIGALGTMWWPYAYIGLETKQSFFLLLSGYLALAHGKILRTRRLLFFAVCCGLAISVKSVGVTLLPAIAYLVWVQFRDDWKQRLGQLAGVAAIIGGIFAISAIGRDFYWTPLGGGSMSFQNWMVHSLLQVPENILGLFASPNKGLFLFAPILILSLWAVPQAFRLNRDLTLYAVLATLGTVALLSILNPPYDEIWGPRFMYGTVGPLLLCIGAAWPRFNWRTATATLVLGVLGVVISFLGSFFYYGMRQGAAEAAGQHTLEWLTGDSVWNEIVVDALLFRVWWHGGEGPVPYSSAHIWAWSAPPDAPAWKDVDMREWALPQSIVFYYLDRVHDRSVEVLVRFHKACMPMGFALLAAALWMGLPARSVAAPMERLFQTRRSRVTASVALLVVSVGGAAWVLGPERERPRLYLSQNEVQAGRDSYVLSVPQLGKQTIVVRYSIDGGDPMEVEMSLDNEGKVKLDVGPETIRGSYTFLEFRARNAMFWERSGAVLTVR